MVLRQPNLAIRKQIKNKIHLREAGLATAQDTRQEERMVCSGFIYYGSSSYDLTAPTHNIFSSSTKNNQIFKIWKRKQEDYNRESTMIEGSIRQRFSVGPYTRLFLGILLVANIVTFNVTEQQRDTGLPVAVAVQQPALVPPQDPEVHLSSPLAATIIDNIGELVSVIGGVQLSQASTADKRAIHRGLRGEKSITPAALVNIFKGEKKNQFPFFQNKKSTTFAPSITAAPSSRPSASSAPSRSPAPSQSPTVMPSALPSASAAPTICEKSGPNGCKGFFATQKAKPKRPRQPFAPNNGFLNRVEKAIRVENKARRFPVTAEP